VECDGLNYAPLLYADALTSNMLVFGDEAFLTQFGLDELMRMGPS
jgi:hypothetical protein